MSRTRQDLVLTGPMAAGKTTVGGLLAGYLGRPFIDLDARIEARTGQTVPELFARGEAAFRAAEADAVRAWLARDGDDPPEVLALGGGTLQNTELLEGLSRRALIVHLDAPPNVLARRLKTEDVRVRPLVAASANLLETLSELREARATGYARADVTISSAARAPEQVAVEVLRTLYDADAGPWRQPARPLGAAPGAEAHEHVPAPDTLGVTVGRGALPFVAPGGVAAVLCDRGLPPCHAERLRRLVAGRAARVVLIERDGGEAAKDAESLLDAWRELLYAHVDRDVPLWVIGGGSLSDLGGMVAHTYKRGLPFAVLPTTLLAQVDAALGGKNGINLDGIKNVAGTVRLPDAVHLDPLFLLTLGPVDLRGGLAEAVKSGLIGDPELVTLIEQGSDALAARPLPLLEAIAARSAAVKLGVVGRDLEERGERRVLNLGHTLGHALEAATARRPKPLAHGDAVAIGMVFAARLAVLTGVLQDRQLPERLVALLSALGLPVAPPELSAAEEEVLTTALARDKKRFRGENVWVLPVAPGRMAMRAIATRDVAAALRAFRG